MPSKEEVGLLGSVVSEMLLRLTGFGPSRQICDEFASQVMAEARQMGINPLTLIVKGTDGKP